ncbi:hypothetical protein Pse7367_3213 [Thalassoporum mexicanum PCC 7367]|uniref:COG4280 domain-containing protein n=1 Tax=Thalassoporum mexicanum TaxID=3457544 RepID=UPI00029FCA37|nr:hypothetical protein [Pseudanabaena sp. PCC 7367]AFY71459.1 hypothetical protein Pse7367_3213 [Pseudanabaena sp. PCC 7367]
MNWSIFVAALSSSAIEFLEVVAIAYAIAHSGYIREAIAGSLAGLIGIGILSAISGSSLQLVPLQWLQLSIGVILVWFGFGWVKKSITRQVNQKRAGWIGDDVLIAEGIEIAENSSGFRFSWFNFVIMTKSAALEALEVAIIVVTLGLASSAWTEALTGTALALLLSLLLATILHPYLVKLPDVLIKLGAGIVISSLGTFWLGEGMQLTLPLGDFTILALIATYAIASMLIIYIASSRKTESVAN